MAPPSAEFVPWGNKRPAAEPSFVDNDFPVLGEPSPPMMKGVGRGRGSVISGGSNGRQDDDEDAWKRDRDARKYY